MRERIAYGIVVAVMILLFTFTFFVLGKGDYQPPDPSEGGQGRIVQSKA